MNYTSIQLINQLWIMIIGGGFTTCFTTGFQRMSWLSSNPDKLPK